MHIQQLLRQRLADALQDVTADGAALADMLRPTQDSRFGDYQANCAMSLAKSLGQPPRQVAQRIVDRLDVADLCDPPEIAGPGFINLRLSDHWIAATAANVLADPQLGVPATEHPQIIVVDYSGPNVAKPMHVGHIRSTVIGDALARVFRFLGHRTITDNHLGDWGTQFGMIIYGYKYFVHADDFASSPVSELSRLYRLVNNLIEYHKAVEALPAASAAAAEAQVEFEQAQAQSQKADPQQKKKMERAAQQLHRKARAAVAEVEGLESKVAAVEADPALAKAAAEHPDIARAVLVETAKLHEGDAENRSLWERFLPPCTQEINRIYQRLGVSFDYTLGESFYHSMLPEIVDDLRSAGLARDSEGAVCVFLPQFDSPLIVQKQDGAYLYATTDLATLRYRRDQFHPDQVLYVVDTRQSEHFEKVFAAAAAMGMDRMKLVHVNFGTVLGEDGRPFKTRSGTSVGLEGLLDDAVARARQVVCDPERLSRLSPPLDAEEQQRIAEAVGHGAIKYADLSHHRTSDYRFSLEKMVALDGNTSAYVQYAYARTQGILRAGGVSEADVVAAAYAVQLDTEAERELALSLLRMPEALSQVRDDYAPSALVDYLYDTARRYAVFNDNCPVLKAEAESVRHSRLALVALTGRMLRTGLNLLGIEVVPRM